MGERRGSSFLPSGNGSPGFPRGPCWHQEVGEPSSAWKRRRSQLLTWSPLITPFWRAFSTLWQPGQCANMGFPYFPLLMKTAVVAAVFLWSSPGDKWPLLKFSVFLGCLFYGPLAKEGRFWGGGFFWVCGRWCFHFARFCSTWTGIFEAKSKGRKTKNSPPCFSSGSKLSSFSDFSLPFWVFLCLFYI